MVAVLPQDSTPPRCSECSVEALIAARRRSRSGFADASAPLRTPHAAGAEPRREAGHIQPIGAPATLTGGSARCAEPQSVASMAAE